MLFSVNQASHLYVVKAVKTSAKEVTNVGDVAVCTTDNGDSLYFSYMGEGGLIRSDLVKIANIIDIRGKEAAEMDTPLRTATVKLDEDPVSGQDYIVRIKYSIGSIDNQYIKYGAVHAVKGMSAETFYEEMVKSLNKNFAREAEPAFTFTSSADGLVITEVEPKWVLGTYPQRSVDFEVSVDTIIVEGEEKPWCKEVVYGVSDSSYPNSKKIADLEYFCMGERGDQYRNYNWPNVIPTKYMVDANNESGYDTLNIHYSYVGSNESVQKSEKDMIFVASGDTNLIIDMATAIDKILYPTEENTTEE